MCYPTGGVSWVYNDHDSGFTFRSCLTDLLPQFCHVNGPVLAFIQVITDLKVCVGVCMQSVAHHTPTTYKICMVSWERDWYSVQTALLTGYAPSSAMEAVYSGYWGIGMMTPDGFWSPMQANRSVFIPSLPPFTR